MTTSSNDRRQTAATTRAGLLAAARGLLEDGVPVEALNASRVATAASMSRATFYLHFKDKTELIRALAGDQVAWRSDIEAEALSDPELTREQLDEVLRGVAQNWVDHRGVMGAIIAVAEHDPAIREIWRASLQAIASQAATQFRLRWADSQSAPADLDTVAQVLTVMSERACHLLIEEPEQVETVALAMSEIVWRFLTHPGDAELHHPETP